MGKVVVAGVIELLEKHMAMGCGRTLGRGRRVSLVMCCMWRERVLILGSSMILRVVLLLWKNCIRNCLLVLWIKKLGFLIRLLLHLMGVMETGTYSFAVSFRIERERGIPKYPACIFIWEKCFPAFICHIITTNKFILHFLFSQASKNPNLEPLLAFKASTNKANKLTTWNSTTKPLCAFTLFFGDKTC